jgi:hypothetical protein
MVSVTTLSCRRRYVLIRDNCGYRRYVSLLTKTFVVGKSSMSLQKTSSCILRMYSRQQIRDDLIVVVIINNF